MLTAEDFAGSYKSGNMNQEQIGQFLKGLTDLLSEPGVTGYRTFRTENNSRYSWGDI